jgi:hypothetical protein
MKRSLTSRQSTMMLLSIAPMSLLGTGEERSCVWACSIQRSSSNVGAAVHEVRWPLFARYPKDLVDVIVSRETRYRVGYLDATRAAKAAWRC